MIFEPGTFSFGVNYWESKHATEMWRKWDPETIDRDFAVLAENGTEWVRCFPWWRDFQPIKFMRTPGKKIMETRFLDETKRPDTEAGRAGVSEEMMERFETFCKIAEKYNIKLIVCIMTGQMTFGLFTPEAFADMDLYTDPRALKWEAKYIRYFVGRMKSQKAIAAWESGNESRCLGSVQYAETAAFWMTYINNVIRLADPSRPVIGINDPDLSPYRGQWLIEDMAETSDVLSVHPYPMFDNAKIDEYTEIRNVMDGVIQNQVIEDASGKLSFIEETGVRRATAVDAESQAGAMRSILWNAWAGGSHAFLWWCAFDQSYLDIAPYDWPQPTLELGIFKGNRTPYPAVNSIRGFFNFLKKLPFRNLPAQKAGAVCISENIDLAKTTGILCAMNGVHLKFQLPGQPLPDGITTYLMPSVEGRNGLSTAAWEAIKQKVREGSTLYISLKNCFLTDLDELCGTVITGYSEPGGCGKYYFDGFELSIPRPSLRRMKVLGAEVLAKDADGNPVFFRNKYGKGTVYTCAFEAESIVCSHSGMYDTDLFKIYTPVFGNRIRLITVKIPHVLVSGHFFSESRCAVILSNCSRKDAETPIELADGWSVTETFSDTDNVSLEGRRLKLPGNSGLVVLLEKD